MAGSSSQRNQCLALISNVDKSASIQTPLLYTGRLQWQVYEQFVVLLLLSGHDKLAGTGSP